MRLIVGLLGVLFLVSSLQAVTCNPSNYMKLTGGPSSFSAPTLYEFNVKAKISNVKSFALKINFASKFTSSSGGPRVTVLRAVTDKFTCTNSNTNGLVTVACNSKTNASVTLSSGSEITIVNMAAYRKDFNAITLAFDRNFSEIKNAQGEKCDLTYTDKVIEKDCFVGACCAETQCRKLYGNCTSLDSNGDKSLTVQDATVFLRNKQDAKACDVLRIMVKLDCINDASTCSSKSVAELSTLWATALKEAGR